MDKKNYISPRIIQYVPDQVPEIVIQLFRSQNPVTFPPETNTTPKVNRGFDNSFMETNIERSRTKWID